MTISYYSATPGSNTTISGINIDEGCPPGNLNDALRQMMADVRTEYNDVHKTLPLWCGTAGGTVNALVLTPTPALGAYVAGAAVQFVSAGANTSAVTAAVSGLGEAAVTSGTAAALAGGEIPAGALVTMVYDGAAFRLAAAAQVQGAVGGARVTTDDAVVAPLAVKLQAGAGIALAPRDAGGGDLRLVIAASPAARRAARAARLLRASL
ncbi:MAG: hypothetical protein K2Q10_03915 [Rhodospirillales bacterium]|nr:hypothetical protein [Rhodospirillales bacterium]